MRELRIGIYTQKFDLIDEATDFLAQQCREIETSPPPTVLVTTHPFSPEWFRSLPVSFQFYLLDNVLHYGQENILTFPQILDFIKDKKEFSSYSSDELLPFQRLLFNQFLYQGDLTQAGELIKHNPDAFSGTGATGSVLFLNGELENAIEAYEKDIEVLKSYSDNGNVAFFGPSGIFHVLALLQFEDNKNYNRVADQISIALTNFTSGIEVEAYHFLAAVINNQLNSTVSLDLINIKRDRKPHSLTILFAGLCQYWLNSSIEPELEQLTKDALVLAKANDYKLLALGYAEILEKISHDANELDDYIGVSNTNMHLSALLGRPCKVLPPLSSEFRWMTQVTESPWFPGFTIYRQSSDGQWQSALSALEEQLA